jgi:hypothetical protein
VGPRGEINSEYYRLRRWAVRAAGAGEAPDLRVMVVPCIMHSYFSAVMQMTRAQVHRVDTAHIDLKLVTHESLWRGNWLFQDQQA